MEKDHGQLQKKIDPMDDLLIAIDEKAAEETSHSILPRSQLLTKAFTQMKKWRTAMGMESKSSHQQERLPPQRHRFFR